MKKIFTLFMSLIAGLTAVKGQITTFSYTGAMQTYTVPAGVTSMFVQAWGAQGGSGALGGAGVPGGVGGLGGYAEGFLAVTPGDVLNIFVGGQGATPTGGYNGGGNGGSANAGGGGGASDIRVGGTAEANRVIVAGGAGGGGRGGCHEATASGGIGGFGAQASAGVGQNGFDSPQSSGAAGGGKGGNFGSVQGAGGPAGVGCSGFLGDPGLSTTTGTGGNGGAGQTCCCSFSNSIPGGGGGGGGFIGGGGGGGGSAGTTGCAGNSKGAGAGGGGGSNYIGGVTTGVTNDGIWSGDGKITILVPVMASSTLGSAIACKGGTTSVTVSGMYGDGVYSGTGIFTVGAGTYTYTVTDGTSDTATTTIVVTEPSAIVTSATQTNISCNGLTDGTLNLTVSGGTPGYTFLWSNGATTEDLTALASGTYTAVLTDANGCTSVDSITITEPLVLAATSTNTNPSTCLGTNGIIDITVSGGTAGYTYIWDNGVTSEDQTAATAGTYSVTITDSNGCTASVTSITLTDPVLPSVTISGTSTICNETSTTLTGSGAVSYVWAGGPSTAAITVSPSTSTTYTVTGTDANSCSNTATQLVTVNTVNVATTTSGVTISASATASSYQWINCPSGSSIPGATTQSYTATANGSYAVIVTTGSCSDTSSCVTINTIGINEYSQNNTLEVFPNPNTGTFIIQSSIDGTYSIVNELGQAIKTVTLNAENNFKMNVENLEVGIYLITGKNKNSVVNKRFVVTK